MHERLHFTVPIDAPRQKVWDTMLDPEGYRAWTAPFCEGSHYEGSWEQGAKIRFLAPSGDGMAGEIAERRPGEFLSIRYLGEIHQGVEDTHSLHVRNRPPAFENYRFTDRPGGGTELQVDLDSAPTYVAYMRETYSRALQQLKALCEA